MNELECSICRKTEFVLAGNTIRCIRCGGNMQHAVPPEVEQAHQPELPRPIQWLASVEDMGDHFKLTLPE